MPLNAVITHTQKKFAFFYPKPYTSSFKIKVLRDFTKRVYESTIEGRGVRGRPPVKWINRVAEYWIETAGGISMECAERECLKGRPGDNSAVATPLGEVPGRGRGVGDIDIGTKPG